MIKRLIVLLFISLTLSAASLPILTSAPNNAQCGIIKHSADSVQIWCWYTYPNLILNAVIKRGPEGSINVTFTYETDYTIVWDVKIINDVFICMVQINGIIVNTGNL